MSWVIKHSRYTWMVITCFRSSVAKRKIHPVKDFSIGPTMETCLPCDLRTGNSVSWSKEHMVWPFGKNLSSQHASPHCLICEATPLKKPRKTLLCFTTNGKRIVSSYWFPHKLWLASSLKHSKSFLHVQ